MIIEHDIDNTSEHIIVWLGQTYIFEEGENSEIPFVLGNENKTWSLPTHNDTWIISIHSI